MSKFTPEQLATMKLEAELKAKLDAEPLRQDELKGKIDIKWYGHSGFKISFKDAEETQRSIYVDIWIENNECLKADKD